MNKKFRLSAEQIRRLVPDMGSCFATDKITVDGEKVGYMYREKPDDESDSGWRFLSGTESQEYMDEPNNMMLYDVNTICNYDSVIIPYLNAKENTAFERTGPNKFIEVPFEGGDDTD